MLFNLIFIFLVIYQEILISSKCTAGQNFCEKCNPITKLCAKCYNSDVLVPDEDGGCEGKKKCDPGVNFCTECDDDEKLCSKCEEGYLPDENGGCTYAINCEVSSEGICIKCIKDYILIGKSTYNNIYDNLKICKYNNSEEFKNCEAIDTEKGNCHYCKQDYFLTEKDKKCIKVQFCAEAKFGVCKECNSGYYYDKAQDKCLQQKDPFIYCKISLDGETCETCIVNFYLDENGKCILNNNCLSEKDFKCEKCAEGYFLSQNSECTKDKNCKAGNKDLGVCVICNDNYYIDFKDGKCKSNIEEDEFKFCKTVDDDICTSCIQDFYLSKDNKCTYTNNCLEAEDGLCLACNENFYLGLDNRCSNVKDCIYSKQNGECIECKDNYYYDTNQGGCKEGKDELLNCKIGIENMTCSECKNDYYLNQTDYLCYSNLKKNQFYKCAITDYDAEFCKECEKGYYLGTQDLLCSKVEGCEISENENRCLKCDTDFYCLDKKTGNCEKNYEVENEEKKIYYRCNETNKEGTKCEKCIEEDNNNYVINDEGICVDNKHCVEKEDGVCTECSNDLFDSYCLNDVYGCIKSIYENCLECNDILNLYKCTKCHDGYILNKYNICYEKK